MEDGERLHREAEIERSCDIVDKRVDKLLAKLDPNRDANLIKQVQDEMHRVREHRAKTRSEYEKKLHDLEKSEKSADMQFNKDLEYNAFLMYRSFISVYHTAVNFLIQEWRDSHSLADWDIDCDT